MANVPTYNGDLVSWMPVDPSVPEAYWPKPKSLDKTISEIYILNGDIKGPIGFRVTNVNLPDGTVNIMYLTIPYTGTLMIEVGREIKTPTP